MFLDFYGLREQPFGVTPDPRYLYLSVGHREALASLIYGVESGRGFMALVAKPGMGKTTLLFQLLERLRSSAQTVFLFQTQCESREFLRYILADLGFDTREQDLVTLHRQFNEVLIREKRAGKRFVLAIDEAQNLNESVLETIRLLSDFETPRDKLMQIIVAGQPQLAQKLALPSLAQLRQRVSMLVRLNPFTPQETVSCVEHRLRVAGYTGGPLFTPEAQAIIAARSEGIPRNIVNLCFHALSLGCALERKIIDTEIVQEVLADLDVGTLVSAPPDGLEPVGAPEQSFETVLTTPIAFDAVGPEAVAGSAVEVPASAALEALPAVAPALAPDALVSAVEPEALAGSAMEVPASVSPWRRLFLRWSRCLLLMPWFPQWSQKRWLGSRWRSLEACRSGGGSSCGGAGALLVVPWFPQWSQKRWLGPRWRSLRVPPWRRLSLRWRRHLLLKPRFPQWSRKLLRGPGWRSLRVPPLRTLSLRWSRRLLLTPWFPQWSRKLSPGPGWRSLRVLPLRRLSLRWSRRLLLKPWFPQWSRKRWPWPRSRLFRSRQSSQFHSRWLQPQPNSRRCQRQWLICRALCEVKKGVVLVWRFGLAFCPTRSLVLFNAGPCGFLL